MKLTRTNPAQRLSLRTALYVGTSTESQSGGPFRSTRGCARLDCPMIRMKGLVGPAVLAVLLAGCAGGEQRAAEEGMSPSPPSPSPTVDEEAIAEAEAEAAECAAQTGDLVEALQELNSRLSVGLVQADYNKELGDIRVVYDRLPIEDLSPGCIRRVGIPAENAFNSYVQANNLWSDCIQDFGCDTDSIDPKLQKKWSKSTTLIEKAEDGLEALAEPG